MKKKFIYLLIPVFFLAAISFSSCSQKTGCPTDDYHAKTRKDGSFSNKPGKSSLFPKNMRKKNKKKN